MCVFALGSATVATAESINRTRTIIILLKKYYFLISCENNSRKESGKLVWCAQTTATHIGHSEREEANAEYGSHGVLGTRSLAYFIISIFAIRIIMNIFTTSRAAIIFCARQRQRRQRKMHNHNKGCFIRVRSPCARVCEWASACAPNVCERSQTNVYTSHTRTPNSHSQLATRIHTHTHAHMDAFLCFWTAYISWLVAERSSCYIFPNTYVSL